MERLTLEDAIKHAKEVADMNYNDAEKFGSNDSVENYMKANCMKCAEQHEQLAEWLEELRSYKDVEERYKLGDTVYCVGPDGSSYQICLYRYMSTVKDYIITYASDDNMNVDDTLSEMCINSQAWHDIDVTLYKKQYVFATYKEAEEKVKDLDNKLNLLGEYRPVLSLQQRGEIWED